MQFEWFLDTVESNVNNCTETDSEGSIEMDSLLPEHGKSFLKCVLFKHEILRSCLLFEKGITYALVIYYHAPSPEGAGDICGKVLSFYFLAHLSLRPSVCVITLSNMNISETNRSIPTKFYLKHHLGRENAA